MVLRHVWLIPVAAVSSAMIGMFSGYIIGVVKTDFPALLPFISDVGTILPEAAIFAQFVNISSFFYALTFYIRHRQAVEYYGHRLNWEHTKWRCVSLALMFVGFAASLGMSIVANFRDSELHVVHAVGALLTFFTMLIYGWGQVIFGYALIPRMASMPVNHLRLLLMIFSTCCLILHELAVSTRIFIPSGAGDFPGWRGYHWFKKDSPFYRTYIIGSSAEWAMTLAMQLFILSFVAELRFAYAHAPRVNFRRSANDIAAVNEWIGQPHVVKFVDIKQRYEIASDW